MVADIKLLAEHFIGKKWDRDSQLRFTQEIDERDEGKGKKLKSGNRDIAARDRINRSPKKFGFVRLKPTIALTPAGEALLGTKRTSEIFLRQFLKYQLPSPFHNQEKDTERFRVKPYLELFRLIRHFGSLTFDELRLFGLQLTDYRAFDDIVSMIDAFRRRKAMYNGMYKKFLHDETTAVVKHVFRENIAKGKTRTRQTTDSSLADFVAKKARNMRDYADAIFRHLRATEMVDISQSGRTLSIRAERMAEVDYFLRTIDREPLSDISENDYIEYLGNIDKPYMLSDDRDLLIKTIGEEYPQTVIESGMTVAQLKEVLAQAREERKRTLIDDNVKGIKARRYYDDIIETFDRIKRNEYYDNPLMFEWNAWRAITMMDGGKVVANLNFDDHGDPLSAAPGNAADIVCDYGSFALTVELTLSSGQRQFATECEPVPRHLGRYKRQSGKQTYCLFIAPAINNATIAHFFSLHMSKIGFYGGDTIIIPLTLNVFETMLSNARKQEYTPQPQAVEAFFLKATEIADRCSGEDACEKWYNEVSAMACLWPNL